MLKTDHLLVTAFQPGMSGQDDFIVGNFNPVHKDFQPQWLTSILAGDGIAVGFKLHQG